MPQHKPRVLSLFPAATEMVCALGLRSQLIGVSHACHWPPSIATLPRLTKSRVDSSSDSGAIDAQVRFLLGAGQPLYEIDEQQLGQLRPDVIITQSQCEVCAVDVRAVERLVEGRVEFVQTRLLTLNPRSLADVLIDLERTGAACQAIEAATAYTADLRGRIAAVASSVPRSRRRPRVVVIEWIDPLMVAGNWTPELVALAGGEYGLARPGAASPLVSWSEIVQYGPELLIVAPCGFDAERSAREAQQLHASPAWKSLPAVAGEAVHVVDGDAYFNCPGPRLVDTLELVKKWIPDVMI